MLVATIFASCKKENHDKSGILKGPEVAVHLGKAWTWVEVDENGNPKKMAVAINDAAINSLPTSMTGEGGAGGFYRTSGAKTGDHLDYVPRVHNRGGGAGQEGCGGGE